MDTEPMAIPGGGRLVRAVGRRRLEEISRRKKHQRFGAEFLV